MVPSRNDDSPIRTDLVTRVRLQIQRGGYDTPDKLERALERLLEQIDPDAPADAPPAESR
jgi:hypothetical protein